MSATEPTLAEAVAVLRALNSAIWKAQPTWAAFSSETGKASEIIANWDAAQNDGWVRQRWLRILEPGGGLWMETSSPGEVRDASARSGWPVQRLWSRAGTEHDWRPVSVEELAQDCRAEDEFYSGTRSGETEGAQP